MRRIVFVYARSDSRRLPRKALSPLAGSLLIDIVLARAARVNAEACALLTSARGVDDTLAEHVTGNGVTVIRGAADDLVARSLQAIEETGATHFLRVNGDSPLFSPELAKAAMAHLDGADLVSNLIDRRFPYGVSVEWLSARAYRSLAGSANREEREHVTQHLYRQKKLLTTLSLTQLRDDSSIRLSIDTLDDLRRLSAMIGGNDPVSLSYWQLLGTKEPHCIFAGETSS